ncbi:MAG: hypothetical protein HY805_09990 [Nitrospirae bacterium]|nr:hypothetical protein [Nitrospirota bacterium]
MKKILLISGIILLLSSCEKEAVKPPSEDSLIAQEAFGLADSLRSLYEGKDFEGLKDYATEQGYNDIKKDLAEFKGVSLSFTPRLVEIKAEAVYLNISWQASWSINGKVKEAKGMAVFELTGSPLKLNRIIRASPFKIPD